MTDSIFRPKAIYPIYPPYHKGKYLEEYFYEKYMQNIPCVGTYLSIFWTNIYCNDAYLNTGIPNELNNLYDLDEKSLFTIVQHDDGVRQPLPKNTKIFSAGGLQKGDNIIPIPLICSPIPKELIPDIKEKTLLASFVGSLTHQIRNDIYLEYGYIHNADYSINVCSWSNNVPLENLKFFINTTLRSKFTLCPRGYGSTSFRLYETFQLNSVPVYISDDHYLPWSDELNWNEFCVLIKPNQIKDMDNILRSIDDDKYKKMLSRGKEVYLDYFTLDGMYNNIIKRLQ